MGCGGGFCSLTISELLAQLWSDKPRQALRHRRRPRATARPTPRWRPRGAWVWFRTAERGHGYAGPAFRRCSGHAHGFSGGMLGAEYQVLPALALAVDIEAGREGTRSCERD